MWLFGTIKRSSGIFAVAIARLFPGIWYIVAALVIIPVIIFLFSTERLYFLEALVTSEPTDKEYKVAIVALEDVLEKSKMVEISKGDSFGEMIITAFYAMLKDEFSEEKCKDCPKYEICKKKSQKK